jgi:hypothetical protein
MAKHNKKKKNHKGPVATPPSPPTYVPTNEIIHVPFVIRRGNVDASHPLSFPRVGRWIDLPNLEIPQVANEAAAVAAADQALIDAGTIPVRVRLTTEIMHRGLGEVYQLDITDAYNNPIESGQGNYQCRGWAAQLGPPWEMIHVLKRTVSFQSVSRYRPEDFLS